MGKPIRNISVKRRVMAIFAALALPAVLIMSVYAVNAMEAVKAKLAHAGGSSLQLFAASLENQMEAVENHMVDLALRSEELRRLGEEESRTQAYLDGYEVNQGFSSLLASNEGLAALLFYSVDNELYMARYGALAGSGPLEKGRIKLDIQSSITELVSTGPLDAWNWFAREIGGRTYWVRVVRYRGVYLAAAIDLDLLSAQAVGPYEFEGPLSFWDGGEEPLVGDGSVVPDQLQWNGEGYAEVSSQGQVHLAVEAWAGTLRMLHLMPFQDAQGAMGPLETALVICTALALVAVPLIWLYLRRTVFRPLDALVDTMEKIGGGELTARPSTMYNNKEFRQVNDTFNSMIGQITDLKIDRYERQLAAERSEMAALRMQIRPHFVLNCLKTVYALAQTGRMDEIQSLILLLSRHLRYVLNYTGDTVPLQRELELCQNYLELRSVGQDQVSICRVELDPRLKDLPVPPVSLLTLVENSVKHGVREGVSLKIAITARRLDMEQGALADISVEDNGTGFPAWQLEAWNRCPPQEQDGRHVGLANTIRRFQLLYGADTAVAFTNGRGGGARIELFLPLGSDRAAGEENEHEAFDLG